MRRTEEGRQREETGGFLQSDWPSLVSLRAAWCTPSHSPWLFLPKCCFDQDNITGMEMGMQTRGGGVHIGTQLTGCHFLASRLNIVE